jgi:tetratricopeptide (TPR) repeat protein
LAPGSAEILVIMAPSVIALGDYQEGLAIAKQAAALDPSQPSGLIRVGRTFAFLRQFDSAAAYFGAAGALGHTPWFW